MNFTGNGIASKCVFYFVLIFTLFMVHLPEVEALSKYQTLIKTVYVDFDTNTLTIVGVNLQYKDRSPGVTLGEDTLSLISYAPNVIEANLPVSFMASPGDYLLTVTARENRDKKYDAYSLTIGAAGLGGIQGLQGEPGLQGPKGDQGLQGEQGIQGDAGPQGPVGINGETGLQGSQGIQGAIGPKGDTGDTGSRGPRGYQGLQGSEGDTGPAGNDGTNGTQGAEGPQGPAGECDCPITPEGLEELYRRIDTLYSRYSDTNFLSVAGGIFTREGHEITVSSFDIGRYEVTNAQAAEVFQWAYDNSKVTTDSNTVQNASGDAQELLDLDGLCQISFSGGAFSVDSGKEDYPCVEITWYGAVAFSNYLSEKSDLTPCYNLSDWSCDWTKNGYRLPTEAEWEYAARGGSIGHNTLYSGSGTLDFVGWYSSNSGNQSHAIASLFANELGIFDMSGNVVEWCWDWYAPYPSGAQTNPHGSESGTLRVFRGGSWHGSEDFCRVSYRFSTTPVGSGSYNGFRLVRAPAQRDGRMPPDEHQ